MQPYRELSTVCIEQKYDQRYLREVDLDGGDDEMMTMKVERILGGAEHLNHLPDLLRLVAAEQMRSSSGGGGGSDGGGGDDHM